MNSTETILSDLKDILSPDRVLTGTDAGPYLTDTLRPSRHYGRLDELTSDTFLVVLPETTEEVARVVQLAVEHKTPIVPYGGGTGLMGGAAPTQGGIVVDMKRMDRVLEVSKEDMWAVAQAGVVLGDLNAAMKEHRLVLGHDPWTVPVATLGGAISTNGLGYLGYKYGSMGQQVLGLEAVLPNGQIINTPPVPQASAGLPLKRLFIGTEGVFGVITRATVRAFPMPQKRRLMGYRFDSFESGFKAVQEVFSSGLEPSMLDFGEEYPHLSSEEELGAASELLEVIVYLGFEGNKDYVAAACDEAKHIFKSAGGSKVAKKAVDSFWNNRHWGGDRSGWSRTPDILTDYAHMALPPSRVLPYRDNAIRIVKESGLHLRECGLWNQPGLFSVVVQAPASRKEELYLCMNALLASARDMDGSMEYCHGVGLRLSHLMEHEMGDAGMELMRSIKAAVDPHNIMNPGKMGL